MKTVVVSLAVVALVVGGVQAATNVVDLGTGDSLSVVTDDSLTIRGNPATSTIPARLFIRDDKAGCELNLVFGIPPHVFTTDQLKEMLQASAQSMVAKSVEGKADVKTLPSQSFVLLCLELTDKREDAREGRFMLQGLGSAGKYVCQFGMISKEKSSDAKAAILKALGTMKLVAKE